MSKNFGSIAFSEQWRFRSMTGCVRSQGGVLGITDRTTSLFLKPIYFISHDTRTARGGSWVGFLSNTEMNLELKTELSPSCHTSPPYRVPNLGTLAGSCGIMEALVHLSAGVLNTRGMGKLAIFVRFSTDIAVYLGNGYNGTLIGSHGRRIEWYNFRWP